MSVFFLIPLGATSLGGAMALGALFHYFNGRRSGANSTTFDRRGVSATLDEIKRRERSLTDFCDRANAELDAKRDALEALTRRASEAAATLGRVLDSFSSTFGDSAPCGSVSPPPRTATARTTARRPTARPTTFEPFSALEVELRTELGANRLNN